MAKTSSTSNSNPVRRFLLRMVLPVLVPVVVFCLIFDGWFTRTIVFKSQTTGATKIHRIYTEVHPNEIPIFGSSRAAGSYIPSEIDSNCWNYGIENSQFGLIKVLLAQELAKPKSTPVIVNFDYEMFQDFFPDMAHLIPNAHYPEIRAFMGDRFHFSYHIPTIRYFSHFDGYTKNNLAQTRGKNLVDHGGFFLRDPYIDKAFQRQVKTREKSLQRFYFKPTPWMEMDSLLRSHPERMIHLVVAPYHLSYFKRFPEFHYAQYYLAYINRLPNVKVHDFAKTDYPDSLFKNTSHLNLKGAQRFSRELRERIF